MIQKKSVLIIEDDRALGRLLKEAFQQEFNAVSNAYHPNEAKKLFESQHFDLVIVDCMLPQTGGVELLTELRKLYGLDFVSILISGIFTNEQFITEALEKTKSSDFLKKPFKIEELIESSRSSLLKKELNSDFTLKTFFSFQDFDDNMFVSSVNSLSLINSDFLAFFYIQIQERKLSGDFYIQALNSPPSIISFYEGKIQQVELQDKESFFGVLLVENGFATPDEINKSLSTKSKKRIGEKLVDCNFLSPHAIHIVNSQQMAIRLSKTLNSQMVNIELKLRDDYEQPDSLLDPLELVELTNNWIFSKYNMDWYSVNLLSIANSKFRIDKNKFELLSKFTPFYNQLNDLAQQLQNNETLDSLVSIYPDFEYQLYSAFTWLVMHNIVLYNYSSMNDSLKEFNFKQKRLEHLDEQFENRSFFEILGVSEKATSKEVTAAYKIMAINLHPDKLSINAPEDLLNLNQKVFSKVTEAYNTLVNKESKIMYLNKLKNGDINSIFEAERLVADAKKKLAQQQYKDAYILMAEAIEKNPNNDDVISHYIWAKLKYAKNIEPEKLKNELDLLFAKIPPESKHNEVFFLLKGLYYKKFGDLTQSRKFFKYAITINSKFLEARRELLALESNIRNNHSSLVDELSTVFGAILKKKKKKKIS